ncbi:MAG: arsenate reductase ArsC, partial [Burkholderiales bacterium]
RGTAGDGEGRRSTETDEGVNPAVPTVLFLCVANSARSQLAEGLARAMAPPGYSFLSAGSQPGTLNRLTVAALAEIGIDISRHRAKGIDEVPLAAVETIVTLCAEEVCPAVPGTVRRIHWPLPDPAGAPGSDAERLVAFRRTRDRLRELLPALWSTVPSATGSP